MLLYKLYIKTNYLNSNEFAIVGTYLGLKNVREWETYYKNKKCIVDTKIVKV